VCEILNLRNPDPTVVLFSVFSETPEPEVLNKIKEPPFTPGENRRTPVVTG
jgi:hypothetical protein